MLLLFPCSRAAVPQTAHECCVASTLLDPSLFLKEKHMKDEGDKHIHKGLGREGRG